MCIEDEWNKAAYGVAVVLVVLALVGGGFAGAAVVGAVGGLAGSAAIEEDISVRTASGRSSASRGLYDETWSRLRLRSLRQRLKQINREFRCALRSTGQVQQFFVREPCRSLQRTVIPLADAHGNTIIVAIAWVRMYNSSSAIRLDDLIDADGTGGIQPLASALLEYEGVQFTGQHYAVRRSGSLVVIAEATPWRSQPSSAILDSIASVSAEFPPP